jgi:hypothetical protein
LFYDQLYGKDVWRNCGNNCGTVGYAGEEQRFSNRQPKAKDEWLPYEREKSKWGKL